MPSRVVTVRIEPELLARIRSVAKAERRSVSAQLLHAVRSDLDARPVPGRKPLPTLGWLANLEAPDTLDEFRRVRRRLSRRLGARAVTRSA
jgi:hypothetical protein